MADEFEPDLAAGDFIDDDDARIARASCRDPGDGELAAVAGEDQLRDLDVVFAELQCVIAAWVVHTHQPHLRAGAGGGEPAVVR